MGVELDSLPEEKWREHMVSIPPQLRFPVFNLSDPQTKAKLLEMMLLPLEASTPEKRAVIASLKEKTITLYKLQEGPIINSPEANRLFSEVGDEWLDSLTPEERSLAMEIHRQWFAPELTIRHSNQVWVRPDRLKSFNEQFERYAGKQPYFEAVRNRTEEETIFLMVFPWDMQAPDFTARYETDGVFIAPRRESCNCGTDVDCLPGTVCRILSPGVPTDHQTACHLLGVVVSCRGRCEPADQSMR